MAAVPDDMPDPVWASSVFDVHRDGTAAQPGALRPPPFATAAEARDAADTALSKSCEPAAVIALADGSGYAWATAADVPAINGWALKVRTYEGVWLRFSQPQAALEFLTVEQSISNVRRMLLGAVSTWEDRNHVEFRTPPAAVHLATVLDTLRREREMLYPTG